MRLLTSILLNQAMKPLGLDLKDGNKRYAYGERRRVPGTGKLRERMPIQVIEGAEAQSREHCYDRKNESSR